MIRCKVAVAGGLRVGNAIADIDCPIRVLVRRIGRDGHRPTRKCGPRRKIQSIHVTIAANDKHPIVGPVEERRTAYSKHTVGHVAAAGLL